MESIGLIILILILYFKVDFKELLSITSNLYWPYLMLSFLLLFLKTPFNPYRWQYILKKISINYPFLKSFKVYYLSTLLGIITPARTGEIIYRISALKKENYPLTKSLISIIIDRMAEIFFLLVFSLLGILLFFNLFGLYSLIIILAVLGLLFLIFILAKKGFIEKLFWYFIPKNKFSFQKSQKAISKNLNKLTPKNYLIIFFLTALTWIFIIASMKLLALSWGITTIPLIYFAASIFLSRLAGLLPISIGGLGTRETTLLFFFAFFAIPEEKTIAFSLSMFLLGLIHIALINLFFLIKPNHHEK